VPARPLPAGSTGAPATKAAGGVTLAAAITPGTSGPLNPTWNEYATRRFHVEWVYAAVRATAQRIVGQPVKIGRKRTGAWLSGGVKLASNPTASGANVREMPEHPLHDLFDHPNAFLTESTLIGLIVSALEVSGTAFVWYETDTRPGPNLWFIPTGWIREDPEAEVALTRFVVRPENSTDEFHLTSDELIRLSYQDPANPLQSLSPLRACYRSVLADENILDSQNAAFKNGAQPGLIVKVGSQSSGSAVGSADDAPALTSTQRRVLVQRIKEATSGAANAGEPIILDAIIKEVTPYTTAPAEMGFTESSLLTRDRILAVFGVPKVIVGMTDDANRASAVVSDETFCFHKCAPICRLLSDHFTQFFRVVYDDPELVVWIDHPRPRDPDGKRADLGQLIGASAITIDELRQEHGLPPLPGGKGKVLVKTQPASSGTSPPSPPSPSGDPPDRDDRPGEGTRLFQYMNGHKSHSGEGT
jgi:hypothetical protein